MRILRALPLVSFVALPCAAAAQMLGSGNGFALGRPSGSFTINAGYALAMARSDLFSFTTNELTINKRDFSSPALGADLTLNVTARTAITVSGSYARMSKPSEFRDFIGSDSLPIAQNTSFIRAPITVSVRRYLTSPGRAIGKLAWIPARAATYVGVGGGTMFFKFHQNGDFIDFKTNDVFPSTFEASGWTTTLHGMAGVDYSLNPRLALTGEARYIWAEGSLSPDFADFERLDLSGLATTVGLSIRF
jgi:opacity protein-like surface antigen